MKPWLPPIWKVSFLLMGEANKFLGSAKVFAKEFWLYTALDELLIFSLASKGG